MEDQANDDFGRLERIFPDPGGLFDGEYKSIENVKAQCLVSLDTNVLLAPYKLGSESFEDIAKVFEQLSEGERIFLPAHVVREYARRRQAELAAVIKAIQDRASRACGLLDDKSSFLDGNKIFIELKAENTEIEKQIKKSRKTVNSLIAKLSDPINGDPILQRYRRIFSGKVEALEDPVGGISHADAHKERSESGIPPGYRDSKKKNNAEGDYLIWMTLIQKSRSAGKDLIFVTGDEKGDWWDQSGGKAFQPRYELIDEFRRATNGQSIHIVQLSSFLKIFNAPKAAVDATLKAERTASEGFLTKALERARESVLRSQIVESESNGIKLELARVRQQLADLPYSPNDTELTLPWNRMREIYIRREAELASRLAEQNEYRRLKSQPADKDS